MSQADVDGEAGRDLQGVPLAELGQLRLHRDNVAAGRRFVAQHRPVGRVLLPVGRGQLQELDGIGLDVETWVTGGYQISDIWDH